MADAEPIIIHGTPQQITITSGSSVTRITPGPTEQPFGQVVVVIDGKETETIPNAFLQEKNWEIRIQALKPATKKPGPARKRRA